MIGVPGVVFHGSSRCTSLAGTTIPSRLSASISASGAGESPCSVSTPAPPTHLYPARGPSTAKVPSPSTSTPATSSVCLRPPLTAIVRSIEKNQCSPPLGVVWVRMCSAILNRARVIRAPLPTSTASSPESDPVITASPMCPAITCGCVVGHTSSTSASS